MNADRNKYFTIIFNNLGNKDIHEKN